MLGERGGRASEGGEVDAQAREIRAQVAANLGVGGGAGGELLVDRQRRFVVSESERPLLAFGRGVAQPLLDDAGLANRERRARVGSANRDHLAARLAILARGGGDVAELPEVVADRDPRLNALEPLFGAGRVGGEIERQRLPMVGERRGARAAGREHGAQADAQSGEGEIAGARRRRARARRRSSRARSRLARASPVRPSLGQPGIPWISAVRS